MAHPHSSKATINQTTEFFLVAGARYVSTASLASGLAGTITLQFKNASNGWEGFPVSDGNIPFSGEITVTQTGFVRWQILGGNAAVLNVDFVQMFEREIGGGGGSSDPVTAEEVQAALAADPQGALDALAGGTMVLDYIELADADGSPGFTIPENSLGRRGSTPYFGSAPITPLREYLFTDGFTSNGTPRRLGSAVSIPIPASQVAVGNLRFGFDIYIRSDHAQKFMLSFGWAGAVYEVGDYLALPTMTNQNIKYDSVLVMTAATTNIVASLDVATLPILIGGANGDLVTGDLKGKLLTEINGDFGAGATPSETPVGVAKNFDIFVDDLTGANADTIVIRGRVWVGEFVTYL